MTLKDRVIKAMAYKECDIPTLAKAANIKTPSVHDWVNGKSHSMKAGPALRAAAYLGVDALWLAEGEGQMLPAHAYSQTAMSRTGTINEPVPLPYCHENPLVRQVVALMEQTDEAGKGMVLMAASQALERYRPIKQTAA